jgi:GNAT superfamily N-acetyltransferase
MPPDLAFHTAALSDANAITQLINLAFSVERFFVEGDRITAAEVRERFTTGKFLVVQRHDLLAGCVYVELRGDRSYIGLLAVDPNQQRSGIGARLMAVAEDYARANGCRAVDLQTVNLREELVPFYRRLGYVESGTASFPTSVRTKMPCHFVTMTKTL